MGIGDADTALDVVESQRYHLTNQLIDLDGDVAYSDAYFLEYTLTMRVRTASGLGLRSLRRALRAA